MARLPFPSKGEKSNLAFTSPNVVVVVVVVAVVVFVVDKPDADVGGERNRLIFYA